MSTVPATNLVMTRMVKGHLGGSMVERLPSAQGVNLGPGIESHIGLPAGSLLLPLPGSLMKNKSHPYTLMAPGLRGSRGSCSVIASGCLAEQVWTPALHPARTLAC